MNLKFGTDGIRGPVKTLMTPEACLRIGHAVGKVAKELGWDTVMIGKDTRVSGYMLESALQSGFISSGIDVNILGPLPTPGVAYLTKSYRGAFGVVISASHNIYLDNGIKIFMPNGEKLTKEIEKRVEKILNQEMIATDDLELGKALKFGESGARYIEFCKSTVPSNVKFTNLRIVLDCAHGACYKVSPSVFKELGAEVILIGAEPNGYNINEGCGSTHPELLQEEVIKHRADYGVALDGDGDRVVLVDSNGDLLDGDDLLYIMAFANPIRTGPWEGIVGTKMSNFGLEDGLKKLGYKFLRADVGDKYVSQKLLEKGWLLGGETSGHIISKDLVSTGDGTIAALKVISSLMILEKTPSEVLANYNKRPQINIAVSVKNKDVINDSSIQSAISDAQSDITVDRVLVRPSGTESKIRVMVEASDENTAKKYAKDLSQLIESKL